jgi:hypothetical protein
MFMSHSTGPGQHPAILRITNSLQQKLWRPTIIPVAESAWTKDSLGEHFYLGFVNRPPGSQGYHAQAAVDALLKWLQTYCSYRSHGLLAVVFDGAIALAELKAISHAKATGNYHDACAGVIDLQSECFYGFDAWYSGNMEDTGLKKGSL